MDNLLIYDYSLAAGLGAFLGAFVRVFRLLNRPASILLGRNRWLYVACGAIAGILVLAIMRRNDWSLPGPDWTIAGLIGMAVAIGELTSRYRDEPIKALFSIPALVYVLINAGASVIALSLARDLGLLKATESLGQASLPWFEVLGAGFGAMVLLRSSVFRIRVGSDEDVEIGPSSFLLSLLNAADRAVDRLRAQERAWTVARIMENVAHDRALAFLPAYITALMQNLSPEDQGRFSEGVKRIRDQEGPSEQVKALTVGLLAMNYAGEGVLQAAVFSLASEIGQKTAEKAQEASSESGASRPSADKKELENAVVSAAEAAGSLDQSIEVSRQAAAE